MDLWAHLELKGGRLRSEADEVGGTRRGPHLGLTLEVGLPLISLVEALLGASEGSGDPELSPLALLGASEGSGDSGPSPLSPSRGWTLGIRENDPGEGPVSSRRGGGGRWTGDLEPSPLRPRGEGRGPLRRGGDRPREETAQETDSETEFGVPEHLAHDVLRGLMGGERRFPSPLEGPPRTLPRKGWRWPAWGLGRHRLTRGRLGPRRLTRGRLGYPGGPRLGRTQRCCGTDRAAPRGPRLGRTRHLCRRRGPRAREEARVRRVGVGRAIPVGRDGLALDRSDAELLESDR